MDHDWRAPYHLPIRNKRDMELAALRLVVLTGMLAIGAVMLLSRATWL